MAKDLPVWLTVQQIAQLTEVLNTLIHYEQDAQVVLRDVEDRRDEDPVVGLIAEIAGFGDPDKVQTEIGHSIEKQRQMLDVAERLHRAVDDAGLCSCKLIREVEDVFAGAEFPEST
jgi:hypothetical protein